MLHVWINSSSSSIRFHHTEKVIVILTTWHSSHIISVFDRTLDSYWHLLRHTALSHVDWQARLVRKNIFPQQDGLTSLFPMWQGQWTWAHTVVRICMYKYTMNSSTEIHTCTVCNVLVWKLKNNLAIATCSEYLAHTHFRHILWLHAGPFQAIFNGNGTQRVSWEGRQASTEGTYRCPHCTQNVNLITRTRHNWLSAQFNLHQN